MNDIVKRYLICDCDVPGYPMPEHGECSKCGFEQVDREDWKFELTVKEVCKHENTIDIGDSEHTVMVCTDCGREA